MVEYDLLRHGNAENNPVDLNRVLSEKGRKQAQAKKVVSADIVVSSIAKRAVETAKIVTGKSPIKLPCLYLPEGEDGRLVDIAYDKFGSAPLSTYLGEDYLVEPFRRYGQQGVEIIFDVTGSAEKIVVVGHGVLLVAIAKEIAERHGASPELIQKILGTVLGEAEGLRITVEDGKVVDVKNI